MEQDFSFVDGSTQTKYLCLHTSGSEMEGWIFCMTVYSNEKHRT